MMTGACLAQMAGVGINRGMLAKTRTSIRWWGKNFKSVEAFDQGRVQYPLVAKKGLEEIEGILECSGAEVHDISAVSPSFNKSAWLV